MLIENGFFHILENPTGHGIQHKYRRQQSEGEKLVFDDTTNLIWQQGGSHEYIIGWDNASNYVSKLNNNKFAGFSDWRLPTLEEAMSLMEPKRRDRLYIDPIFDFQQQWIWTSDQFFNDSDAWVVRFDHGTCGDGRGGGVNGACVRAVRSLS